MLNLKTPIVVSFIVATSAPGAENALQIEKKEDRAVVTVDGKPFTEVRFSGFARPVLYPLVNAAGERLNREFPFAEVPGESEDHPHHQSLWFGHGDVNGNDFWAVGKEKGTIEVKDATVSEDAVVLQNVWKTPAGEPLLQDSTEIRFGSEGDLRWIDYSVTMQATEGPLTFGDTKEGTMAVRTHPALRIKPVEKGGAAGQALNSEGVTGADLWGKQARWVAYWGEPGGIAIFDSPENLRHPTTWHARDYGLVAANPFGIHDFEGKPAGTGDFVLKEGEKFTLHYRFLLLTEEPTAETLDAQFTAWTRENSE